MTNIMDIRPIFRENTDMVKRIFLAVLLLLLPSLVYGKVGKEGLIAVAEDAVGRKVGDYLFTDQDGKPFRLEELKGKPYIVSFNYSSCTTACPLISSTLAIAVKKAMKEFGDSFAVLTIGFDWERDTPERMKEYGLRFTRDFRQWKFLSGDRETIEAITREFGFFYERVGDHFNHLNMVTVVGRDGRIYKQIYGMDLRPGDIIGPLKEAITGKKGFSLFGDFAFFKSLKLLCSRYNPATGQNEFYFPYLITMAFQVISIVTGFLLLWGKDLLRVLSRFSNRLHL